MTTSRVKPTSKKHSQEKEEPVRKKARRVQLTMPEGLYKEAKKLMEEEHYSDFSNLVQDLVRVAVRSKQALSLNDPPSIQHYRSTDEPTPSEGN